jgi:hypothetical protein
LPDKEQIPDTTNSPDKHPCFGRLHKRLSK